MKRPYYGVAEGIFQDDEIINQNLIFVVHETSDIRLSDFSKMGNSSFSCTYSERSGFGHNYRFAPEWLVVLSTNCRLSTPSMLHLPTRTSTRSSPANHVVITSSSSTGRSSEASPDVECIHPQCRTGIDAFSLARLGAIHVIRRDIYSERRWTGRTKRSCRCSIPILSSITHWEVGYVQPKTKASKSFSRGMGVIVQALPDAEMRNTGLKEHIPAHQRVWEWGIGGLLVTDSPWRLPHTLTLQAVRECDI